MYKSQRHKGLLLFSTFMAAVMFCTSCNKDNDDTPGNNDQPKTTDVITYSILPRDEAAAMFVSEPLHSQLTPLFLDITQQRKGVLYEEWVKTALSEILAPSAEKQMFLDSIAAVQTADMKALGIKLPIERQTFYIDMPMVNSFADMTAFTSGTHVYANLDRITTVKSRPDYAKTVMWHEMWHVISRNNPELRKQMYALISFTVLPEEIEIPEEVKAHILCNPDVERHDSYATFTIEGKPTDCMLMLYTPATEYIEGTSLRDYVAGTDGYWLLALDKETHKPYRGEDGKYVVYNCTEASDFNEVMSGGNTSYCDDPEECLADNFAYAMMSNTTVPNQKLLQNIRNTLRDYSKDK